MASWGHSPVACISFLPPWLLLFQSTGSRLLGFSSCGLWAQYPWHMSLVAPQRVRSPQTRDHTHVPCTLHWPPGESLDLSWFQCTHSYITFCWFRLSLGRYLRTSKAILRSSPKVQGCYPYLRVSSCSWPFPPSCLCLEFWEGLKSSRPFYKGLISSRVTIPRNAPSRSQADCRCDSKTPRGLCASPG